MDSDNLFWLVMWGDACETGSVNSQPHLTSLIRRVQEALSGIKRITELDFATEKYVNIDIL